VEAMKLENNQILLTTGQIAELYSITQRTVQLWIESGKLQAVQQVSNKGKGGVSHMIPLSALDNKRQIQYWKKKDVAPIVPAESIKDVAVSKQFDEFTGDERKVIQQWIKAINEWTMYRLRYKGQMGNADQEWIRLNQRKYKEIGLSVDTLYRKLKALKSNDYDGLIDKRGKWAKGKNSIPETAWEVFKYIYLDENQISITECHKYTLIYFEKEMPGMLADIPGYDAFYRAVKTIPHAVVKYFREGDKVFEDEASPYITRLYDDIEVGEIWVADYHTFDIMSIDDETQRVHRLSIIVFMDVRSRLVTGWHITDNPSSDGVLYALRKGILDYGIPRFIYVDNGSEFLCFDIGGRGHRTKKSDKQVHVPPGVFERLGIKMWNAQVRNAKAKIIERTFREFKEKFSRLIKGFCGGNPLEKPENLKKTLKSRKGMLFDSELNENFRLYVEGMYNETKSKGIGMYERSPNEVFAEERFVKRTATLEDLNLMLMRSSKMQTVGRKGVHLEISGEKLFYWSKDFLIEHQEQKVYLRYDPEDLREVRAYDAEDKYLCTVPVDSDTILKYGSNKEDVKKAISQIRSFKKAVKEYNENSILETMPKIDRLDLMLWKSKKNIKDRQEQGHAQAKILEVVRATEPITPEQETIEDGIINIQRTITNANFKMNAM